MFENEEKKLAVYRKKVEHVSVDEEKLADAIQQGFEEGKRNVRIAKKKRKRFYYSFAAVAILVLTFVTSVRVSPAFANAIASIPGMDKIVELIEYDKGLRDIMRYDYYQVINERSRDGNISATLHGVVLDETGLLISYTVEAPYSIEDINYDEIRLLHNGEEIDASKTYNSPEQKHPNRKEDIMQFVFADPQAFDEQDFTLELELSGQEAAYLIIPFTVPETIEKGRVYNLQEEVEIEGQQLTIEKVTVYPLRIAVEVSYDEDNSMKLLQFEDLRIEDSTGEVWGSIENGMSAQNVGENYQLLYLQSNYFNKSDQLSLKFNKMQALQKEEASLIIDTEAKKVLQKPSSGNFKITRFGRTGIEGKMVIPEEDFPYFLFMGTVVDKNGKELFMRSSGNSTVDREYSFSFQFDEEVYENPIEVEFFAYPTYVETEVEIELK